MRRAGRRYNLLTLLVPADGNVGRASREVDLGDLAATAATFSRGTNYKVTFIALGLVDLMLTLIAINSGYVERNPLFAVLKDNPMGLFFLKVVGPTFIAWLVPAKLLLPSIGLLCAVIGWNIGELVRGV